MSSIEQTTMDQPIQAPARSANVIMGRQDFLSVLLRSTAGELYKVRRRTMPIILAIVGIVIVILAFGVLSLQPIIIATQPAENFAPYTCTGPQPSDCTKPDLSQDQLKALKQQRVEEAAAPLHLPGSLYNAVSITDFIGLIILIIITATVVGGEYSIGTIRLMLTRGPTRTQFFLAKVLAVIVFILITLLTLTLIGIVTGALFNLATGIGADFAFFTGEWFMHAVLLLLSAMLGLLVYCSIALCLATLGKSSAAGLAGGLIWWFVEGVIATICTIVGALNKGALADFVKAIPDYFIGNNISALLANQNHYLAKSSPASTISDLHAILVLAVYLLVFLGVAWWVNQSRDVTN